MCIFADGANPLSHSRTAAVTVSVLKEYKEIIKNTTSDLEEHLQEIDRKLQALSLQGARISSEDAVERQQIQEEKDSTQQCLDICVQVFAHINQVQLNTLENTSTPLNTHQVPITTPKDPISARLVTANTLKECKKRLTNTTSQLEQHLQDINNRLQNVSSQGLMMTPNVQAADQRGIQEEIDSIKQCLAICAQASQQADQGRTHVFEDISMAEDGHQLIVVTLGELIAARRITAGPRSKQWLGQMSDASLQQISRDYGRTATEKAIEPRIGLGTQFEGRYGAGHTLSSESVKDADPANQ